MHITIIGTGYVGLVSGACFAELGQTVECIDIDVQKIALLQQGKIPIYEPGLRELVNKNMNNDRLHFSTHMSKSVAKADVIFIAVGTPTNSKDGSANLEYVFKAVESMSPSLEGYTVIVTKSTVPVNTCQQIKKLVSDHNPEACFDIASNPEFLREGSAIEDFMKPDRIVLGVETGRSKAILEKIYSPLQEEGTRVVITTPETAELTKYAANSFLATKIAFINEISDLCEQRGANVQDLALGVGLDHRIGKEFLRVGPGYGGSCFPKDTKALLTIAQESNISLDIVRAAVRSNDLRKKSLAKRIIKYLPAKIKKLGILGLTFKAETDDMRDSPSLIVIPDLIEQGFEIIAYDPQGMDNARKSLPKSVEFVDTAYKVPEKAEALIILTEWNEFKSLSFDRIRTMMSCPLVIDFRNLYNPTLMEQEGIKYYSLGRPSIP